MQFDDDTRRLMSAGVVAAPVTPFVEQIDPGLEAAARMCGTPTGAVFRRALTPLLLPGILAAGILVLARTFFTTGATSQTLIVTLFSAVFSAGIRALQSIDAMAMVYTGSMLILLAITLRFVNPTQLVARSSAGD